MMGMMCQIFKTCSGAIISKLNDLAYMYSDVRGPCLGYQFVFNHRPSNLMSIVIISEVSIKPVHALLSHQILRSGITRPDISLHLRRIIYLQKITTVTISILLWASQINLTLMFAYFAFWIGSPWLSNRVKTIACSLSKSEGFWFIISPGTTYSCKNASTRFHRW